jgi:hypothetical protein
MSNTNKDGYYGACKFPEDAHPPESREARAERIKALRDYYKYTPYVLAYCFADSNSVEYFSEFEQLKSRVLELLKGECDQDVDIVFAGKVSEEYVFNTHTKVVIDGVSTKSVTHYKDKE